MAISIEVGTQSNYYRTPTKDKKWKSLASQTKLAFVSACLKACLYGENEASIDFENAGVTYGSPGWGKDLFDEDFLEKMLNDDSLKKDLGKDWEKIFSNRKIFEDHRPLLSHVELQKMASFYQWIESVPAEILSLTDENGNDLLMSALENEQFHEALAIIDLLEPEKLLHVNHEGDSAYLMCAEWNLMDVLNALEGKMPKEGFDVVNKVGRSVLAAVYDQDNKRARKIIEHLSDKPDSLWDSTGLDLLKSTIEENDHEMVETILAKMHQKTLWSVITPQNVQEMEPYLEDWLDHIKVPVSDEIFAAHGFTAAAALFSDNKEAFSRLTDKIGVETITDEGWTGSPFLQALDSFYVFEFQPEDREFLDKLPQEHFDAVFKRVANIRNYDFANYIIERASNEAINTTKTEAILVNGKPDHRGFTPLMSLLSDYDHSRNAKLPSDFPAFALIARSSPAALQQQNDNGHSVIDLAAGMKDKSVTEAVQARMRGYSLPANVRVSDRVADMIANPVLEPPTLPPLENAKELVSQAMKTGRITDARKVGHELLLSVAAISDHAAHLASSNFEKSEQVRRVINDIQRTLIEGHSAIQSAKNNPEKLLPAKGLNALVISVLSPFIPGLDQAKALSNILEKMGNSPQEVIDSCFDIIELQENMEEYYPQLETSLLQLEDFLLQSVREIEEAERTTDDAALRKRLPRLRQYFTDMATNIATNRINVFNLATAANTVITSEVSVIAAMNQARTAMTAISINTSLAMSNASAKLAEIGKETSSSILAEQLSAAAQNLQTTVESLSQQAAELEDAQQQHRRAQQNLAALPSPDQMGGNGVPLDLDDEDGEEESVLVPVGETGTAGDPTTQAAATGPA